MNSFIIGLLLVAAPLVFAAFLLFFMMSGKGTTPLEDKKDTEVIEDETQEQKKGHQN